ncbi:helix-turn-helix transcriptional regulator [Arthrobacter sp. KK5.5]|uniref:helix-turn-helix transcriptional regulator n=1 Tax=Arthrobacter sp. KK5.5 TaxID=3373084 RepID=UPI003EE52A2D
MSTKRHGVLPSRTEKLVSLTYALMFHKRGYTKDELRRRVDDYKALSDEAFERKFERDKEDLRALGVPLETLGGDPLSENNRQDSRYRILPERYRLPEVSFDAEEGLALGLAARIWKNPTVETAAARAISRLSAGERRDAEADFETFEPRLHAGDAVFPDLLRAVWDRSPVRFTYRSVGGGESLRRVDPWGIGSRFGNWYLVAWDHDRNDRRIFRLSRIVSGIARVSGVVRRPSDFRVAEVLDGLDPVTSTVEAELQLRPGRGLAFRAAATKSGGATVDGYDVVRIAFHDAEATSAEIAELGHAARVVSPPQLREAVLRRLRDAAAEQAREVAPYTLASGRAPGRPPATDVVARALDIIAYVVREGAPRIDETAARFGLTRQRLIGDLAMIQMCGVPNGYHDELIDVDYEGDTVSISNAEGLAEPIRLNLTEAFSLIVGLRTMLDLPTLRRPEAARSALTKLEGAAGEFGDIGELVSARLASAEDTDRMAALADAIGDHRVVTLGYYTADRDEIADRDVEPVRLIEDGGRAYLQAWCRKVAGPRNFRIDRIQSIAVADETFEPSTERHAAMQERLFTPGADDAVVVLSFASRQGDLLEDFAPSRTARGENGRTLAEVRIASPLRLPGLVARHGGDMAVVDPPELAEAARGWLREAMAGYGEETT